jgi:hypothetical protein
MTATTRPHPAPGHAARSGLAVPALGPGPGDRPGPGPGDRPGTGPGDRPGTGPGDRPGPGPGGRPGPGPGGRPDPSNARASWQGDEGSLPLVLLAAIVFAGITIALFVDVSTGQRTARSDRDFNQAIQVADAGMQSAFTTLADLDPETTGVALGASTAPTTVTVEDGAATWTATRVGRARWQVRTEGTFESTTRVLEATIGPRQLFDLAAFADLKIELRGGNLADSYDGVSQGTDNGAVGSNHEIVLRGNATVDWVKRYNNATYGEKGIVLQGVESTADPIELPNKAEEAYADGGECAGTTPVTWTGQFPLVKGETYCFTSMVVPAGDHRLAAPASPTDEPTRIYLAPSGNLELKGQGTTRTSATRSRA